MLMAVVCIMAFGLQSNDQSSLEAWDRQHAEEMKAHNDLLGSGTPPRLPLSGPPTDIERMDDDELAKRLNDSPDDRELITENDVRLYIADLNFATLQELESELRQINLVINYVEDHPEVAHIGEHESAYRICKRFKKPLETAIIAKRSQSS